MKLEVQLDGKAELGVVGCRAGTKTKLVKVKNNDFVRYFVDGNIQRNVKAEKEFYKNMSIFDLLCKHSASRTLLNSKIL